MKTVIFCEGTTDLIMIQFVLQYRYGWSYDGFLENAVTNKLQKKSLVKDGSYVEIRSCGGIMNIPKRMKEFQEQMEFSTKPEELFDKVIVMIDHDTVTSNKEFIGKLNDELNTNFIESQINTDSQWFVDNIIMGKIEMDLYIKCIPEVETGAIECVMLDALGVDEVEKDLIAQSTDFIFDISQTQTRYLQKKSKVSKAIFNTYFAIRVPEEKYDERAKILKAYDWKDNEIINDYFSFLNI